VGDSDRVIDQRVARAPPWQARDLASPGGGPGPAVWLGPRLRAASRSRAGPARSAAAARRRVRPFPDPTTTR